MAISERESAIRLQALIKSYRNLNVDLLEEFNSVIQDSSANGSKDFNAFMDRNFPGTKILSTTKKRTLITTFPQDVKNDIDVYNSLLGIIERFLSGETSFLLVYVTIEMYKEHFKKAYTPEILASGIVNNDLLDVYLYIDAEQILQKAMSAETINNCQKYFSYGYIPQNKQPFINTNETFNQDYYKLIDFILNEESLSLVELSENINLISDYKAALEWIDSKKDDGMENFLEFLRFKELANKLSPEFFAEGVSKLSIATTEETTAPAKKKKKKKKKKKSATDVVDNSSDAEEAQDESDSEEPLIAEESPEPMELPAIQAVKTAASVDESAKRKEQVAAYKQEVQDKRSAKIVQKQSAKQNSTIDALTETTTKISLKIAESAAEKYLDELRILFSPETREVDYSKTIRMLCGDPAIRTTGLGLTQFNRKGSHLRLEYSDRTVGTVRLTVVDPHAKGNSTKILGYNLKSLRRSIRDLLPEKIMADLQLAPDAFVSDTRRKARPH